MTRRAAGRGRARRATSHTNPPTSRKGIKGSRTTKNAIGQQRHHEPDEAEADPHEAAQGAEDDTEDQAHELEGQEDQAEHQLQQEQAGSKTKAPKANIRKISTPIRSPWPDGPTTGPAGRGSHLFTYGLTRGFRASLTGRRAPS